jgi:hypothetical protein
LLFSKYGKKLFSQETRTRRSNFKKKVKGGKTITLMAETKVSAYLCLIIGSMFVFLCWVLLSVGVQPQYIFEVWIARGISVVIFLYGFLFSL